MARSALLICDICRKETPEIAQKMFLANSGRTNGHRSTHRDYTHHLDVGVCCAEKILRLFPWQPRMSAEAYAKNRKRVAVKRKVKTNASKKS